MRNRLHHFFAILLILVTSFSTFSQEIDATKTHEQELRQFLYNLGFIDIVAQIKQSQLQRGSSNEMTHRQQEDNKVMYETVNASRELAILLYEKVEPRLADKANLYLFSDFVAKMLTLEKIPPNINIPANIINLKDGKQESEATNDWLEKNRRKTMEEHARRIVTDMTTVAFGNQTPDQESIEKMYALTTTIISRMYQDPLIGETKYFGRALAALSAYHAKMSNDNSGMEFVKKRMLDKGKHIENFLGDTWLIDSKQGPEVVHVENGSMVMTRNLAPESLAIGFGAIPAKPIFKRSKKQGTFANLLAAPYFVSPEDLSGGLTWTKRLKNYISQSDTFFNTGFSHIGYVAMKEDPKTGIKMSWTYDAYPHHIADMVDSESTPGGVRFAGLEQMVNRLVHSKILVGSFDHEKFHRYAQRSSYPENGVIFEAMKPVTKDGKLVVDPDAAKAPWMTGISQEDFRTQNGEPDAEKFYKNVSKKFTKEIHNSVVEGHFFQWVTPLGEYIEGGVYCSLEGKLAWAKATGINIEEFPSRWNPVVVKVAKVGDFVEAMGEKNILPKFSKKITESEGIQMARTLVPMTIVAPSSLVAQSFVNTQTIAFETYSFSERARAGYSDYKVYSQPERVALESSMSTRYFQTKHFDAIEKASGSLADIEYAYIMRALKGQVTTGVDVMTIAQDAADKEMDDLLLHEQGSVGLKCSEVHRQ